MLYCNVEDVEQPNAKSYYWYLLKKLLKTKITKDCYCNLHYFFSVPKYIYICVYLQINSLIDLSKRMC